MLFPTVTFGLFFCLVFLASWATRGLPRVWKLVLLTSSLVFYGWWNWRLVGLLVGSILVNWAFGRLLEATESGSATKLVLGIGVSSNLVVLAFFKYYGFFVESSSDLAAALNVSVDPPLVQILLPVGISFFTFQAISYLVDLYRDELSALRLLDLAVYLAFFPQLVAGPIVRATTFIPQLAATAPPEIPLADAITLIVRGLFKKVVVSSVLASELVDPVFAAPSEATRPDAILATYAYAIQIYADFSGYTDIAIGCALLLGFRFPNNFDAPYRATSLQDFWRRWHITLSSWLRDYLYIPLGGGRRGRLVAMRNVMITMVLGGLWHGAAWSFVLWGLIHGVGLALERLARALWRPVGVPAPVRSVLGWVWTFHLVCGAWIVFRVDRLGDARDLLETIIGGAPDPSLASLGLSALVAACIAVQLTPDRARLASMDRLRSLPAGAYALVLAFGLTAVDVLGPEGVAPFIYFQF